MDYDKLNELLEKEFGYASTEFDLFDDFDSTCKRYEFMLQFGDNDLNDYLWNQIFEIDIETFLKKKMAIGDCYPLLQTFIKRRIRAFLDVAELTPTPIKTPNLSLAYLSDDAADTIYQAIMKDKVAWHNLYHFSQNNAEGFSKVKTIFNDRYRNILRPMFYGIYHLSESKSPIGYISLTETDRSEKGESILNLEFFIVRDHRRKGYAEEAARYLLMSLYSGQQIRYEKTEMLDIYTPVTIQPAIVLAYCHKENSASSRLLESIGFIHDGDIFNDKFSQDGTLMKVKKYHYNP